MVYVLILSIEILVAILVLCIGNTLGNTKQLNQVNQKTINKLEERIKQLEYKFEDEFDEHDNTLVNIINELEYLENDVKDLKNRIQTV